MTRLPDQELLALLKKQDNKAFKQLYQFHTGIVKKLVLANSGTTDDAEEVEQMVIMVLYEKLVQGKLELQEGVKLETYLYSIAKNIWLKQLRIKGKSIPLDLSEDSEPGINDPGLESLYIHEGPKEKILVECLESLGEACQSILAKFYYEEKSMRDIALEMKTITEDNLRKRKYKCIQRLKELFNQKYLAYG